MASKYYLRCMSTVRWLRALTGDARGGPLMETVVALSVLTVVGTGVLLGISTIQISGSSTEDQALAENIARNEMENLFAQLYQATTTPTYASISDVPSGYAVTTDSTPYVGSDPNLQKIVVTVSHGGKEILVLETLRVKE